MEKRTNLKLMLNLSFLLAILVICSISQAKVIYVDDSASGVNDGSSWTNAYIYLQDALTEASSGDEIRAAHGTYYPDLGGGITPGDKQTTFQLKKGVEIKGGYVGLDIPDKADERSFNIFETILRRYNNDIFEPNFPYSSVPSIITGNYIDETAVLDGFTVIASGSAFTGTFVSNMNANPIIKDCKFAYKDIKTPFDGDNVIYQEAGFRNLNSNPQIIKCTFEFDTKYTPTINSFFTTMENKNSNPVLTECIFMNNQYCMDNIQESDVILKNCSFLNNSKTVINQDKGSLTIDGCIFLNNSISNYSLQRQEINNAAGCIVNYKGIVNIKDTAFTGNTLLYSQDSSFLSSCVCIENSDGNLTLDRCTFESNYSSKPLPLIGSDKSTINSCTFINNLNTRISGNNVKLENCRFSGNTYSEGSIISAIESEVHNCIFEANKGVEIINSSSVYRELNNCIFYGNMADNVIKYSYNTDTFNLTNCIIRNNSSNTIEGNNINVTYCNIEGGWPGEGNIDIDPCFVKTGYWADVNNSDMVVNQDDPNAIWIMGDYHLKSQAGHWNSETETWVKDDVSSPCIDSGNINSPIGLEPFPNGGIPNIGAYGRSSQASKTYFNNDDYAILAGDITGDSIVDYDDLYVIVSQWLLDGKDFINQKPKVTLIEPQDGDQIVWKDKFIFQAQVIDLDGEVERVDFKLERRTDTSYYSLTPSATKNGDIWSAHIPTGAYSINYGTYTITAIATDNENGVTKETITVNIIAP